MTDVASASNPSQPVESPTNTDTRPRRPCRACDTTLERSHIHSSTGRTHTAFVCPACHRGAAAIVERNPDDLGPLHTQRLAQTQQRLRTNPATDVLAAFVDDALPPGTYRIERVGEYTWHLHLPTDVDDTTLKTLSGRLDTPTTTVTTRDSTLVVSDTRFVQSTNPPYWTGNSDVEESACTDGGEETTPPADTQVPELPVSGGTVGGIQYAADAARTKRARDEQMDVALLEKGGRYEVHSESGNTYHVDVLQGWCSCPDNHECCKHKRRVDLELRAKRVPRPDGRIPTLNPLPACTGGR
jgi:hypothetical protein